MPHALEFDHETELDAVFHCVNCQKTIGFNKAETSDPHATFTGGVWTHPENPEIWMGPCDA